MKEAADRLDAEADRERSEKKRDAKLKKTFGITGKEKLPEEKPETEKPEEETITLTGEDLKKIKEYAKSKKTSIKQAVSEGIKCLTE